MNFDNLTTDPPMLYLYRCEKCGEENDYSVDFGPSKTHARKGQGNGPRCGGREVLMSMRKDEEL
jgi:hypothetical protein